MSFTFLSPFAFALGLFALAGGLYLLQRLRVRHRELEVVTTLFWQEAVHETRARVLVQRFRHPWAYALILAIAALLWTAISDPRATNTGGRDHICLLDTSAGMARGDRLQRAKLDLLDWAARIPSDRRRVIAVGGRRRSLLLPGEEIQLLEARLADIEAIAAPRAIEAEITNWSRWSTGELNVDVFGGESLDADWLAAMREEIGVEFIGSAREGEPPANSGVCALGVAASASGSWDSVDVFVEVRRSSASAAVEISVELDGSSADLRPERRSQDAGIEQWVFRDVPARGELFRVRLAGGDSLALDDSATLRLPNRPRLKVEIAESLRTWLEPVLRHDDAIDLVTAGANLRIADDDSPSELPVLRFLPSAQLADTFLVTYADERPEDVVIQDSLDALGLGFLDTTGLAQDAEVPITLGVRPGDAREVAVWSELLADDVDFHHSRSFPLFVAKTLRWLAEVEEITPWVAVGEAQRTREPMIDNQGRRLDPVGKPFTAMASGAYRTSTGDVVHASLLSPGTTLGANPELAPTEELQVPGRGTDWVTWLLLIALALFGWEWSLVRTEKIP